MKILMIVPQFPFPIVGGLEKQAQLLSVELVCMGHDVSVLSGKISPAQSALSLEQGVEVHRLPWPRSRFYRWTLLWPLAITRMVLLTYKTDVVHAHNYSGFGLLAIVIARLCRKPIIVKLPSVGEGGLPGFINSRFGGIKLQIFKRANAVVAMSVESLMELESIGYDRRRILATPNGIGHLGCATRPIRDFTKPCRVVFIGRLEPGKGLQSLLEAIVILRDQEPRLQFSVDIYGKGREYKILEQTIRNWQLSDIVHLHGHRDKAAEVLTEYDVLVLPSSLEGNSNVILEAMAAGLPVVSTNVGGTPMLLGPEGELWMHQPGDAQALACLLKKLISNDSVREELGAAMRRRVERYFDMRVVAHTYESAYRKLDDGDEFEIASMSNPIINSIQ